MSMTKRYYEAIFEHLSNAECERLMKVPVDLPPLTGAVMTDVAAVKKALRATLLPRVPRLKETAS